MSYQEYKIPGGDQGRYADSISDTPDNFIYQNNYSIDMSADNYLKSLENSIEDKRRLLERQEVLKIHQLIEQVRTEAISKKIKQAKSKKIGSIIDRFVYGSSISGSSDTQESVILSQFLDKESDLGGKLFENTENLEHSFHYHDRNEWFWLCTSKDGTNRQLVRYLIDETNGFYRSVNGGDFEVVDENEKNNLISAIDKYKTTVLINIYSRNDLV